MDRSELVKTLEQLSTPLQEKLMYICEVPRNLIPDQTDRTTIALEILKWAESPNGCGLEMIHLELSQYIKTNDNWLEEDNLNFFEEKSFLKVNNIEKETAYSIYDIRTKSWCKLPSVESHVPKEFISDNSKEIKRVWEWKRVHSLTEKLYPKYIELHICLLQAKLLYSKAETTLADQYKYQASTFFEELRESCSTVNNSFQELEICEAKPISALLHIPMCSPAISQCISCTPDTAQFSQIIDLIHLICEWLINALHIADQIIELYFREKLNSTIRSE